MMSYFSEPPVVAHVGAYAAEMSHCAADDEATTFIFRHSGRRFVSTDKVSNPCFISRDDGVIRLGCF